jgi:hypothetical protein
MSGFLFNHFCHFEWPKCSGRVFISAVNYSGKKGLLDVEPAQAFNYELEMIGCKRNHGLEACLPQVGPR